MVTVLYETFQNIGFSVGIEAKNDPLNIDTIVYSDYLTLPKKDAITLKLLFSVTPGSRYK